MPRFKKPGYTQIPNEIFDDLMPSLSGAQFKVLCLVARKTLGFHRDVHPISLSQIIAGTGLSHQGCLDAVAFLVDGDYIVKATNQLPGKQFNPSTFALSIEGEESQGSLSTELSTPLSTELSTPSQLIGLGYKEERKEQRKEHNTDLCSSNEIQNQPQSQSQNPDIPPAAPTLDDAGDSPDPYGDRDLEGNIIPSTRKQKRSWKKPKVEKPHGASDRLRQLRESAGSNAGAGVAALIHPSRAADTPQSPEAPGVDFPARWNELVPAAPVDRDLLAPNPKAYREFAFAARFDEICRKAAALIAAGADLQFGFLLSMDRATEQYRWQQLLAGQLDWMKPKAGKTAKATAAEIQSWADNIENGV